MAVVEKIRFTGRSIGRSIHYFCAQKTFGMKYRPLWTSGYFFTITATFDRSRRPKPLKFLLVYSRPLLNTDINDPLNLTMETAQQMSPMDPSNFKTIYSNTRRTARFIIIHAENDSPAFHEQSRHFYELLKQTGCNTVLIEIENTDHFGKFESSNGSKWTVIWSNLRRPSILTK